MAITITLTEQDAFDYLASRVSSRRAAIVTEQELADLGTQSQIKLPNAPAAVVPSTAAAVQLPTVLVAGTGTSAAPTAFELAAPSLVPAAPTAAPLTPPAPPAPAASAPPIVPTVPQLDKNGFPWDMRIHASSRAINPNGLWRYKRGLTDDVQKTVEAELKQLMALPSPQVSLPGMSPAVVSASATLPAVVSAPATLPPPPPLPVSASATPPAPPAPPPPPPAPAAAPAEASSGLPMPPTPDTTATIASPSSMSFGAFLVRLNPLMAAGHITKEQLDAALSIVGVSSTPLLAYRPDMIPTVAAALGIA